MLELGGGPANADVPMEFRLCRAAVGEDCPWEQSFAAVPVRQGRFSVRLGGVTAPFADPGSLFDGRELWLDINVQGRTLGRQRLLSVPATVEAEVLRRFLTARRLFVGERMQVGQFRLPATDGAWAPIEAIPALDFVAPITGTWKVHISLTTTAEGVPAGQNLRIATDVPPEDVRAQVVASSGSFGNDADDFRHSLSTPVVYVRLTAGRRYRFWGEYRSLAQTTERLTSAGAPGAGDNVGSRLIAELVDAEAVP